MTIYDKKILKDFSETIWPAELQLHTNQPRNKIFSVCKD